MIEIAICGDDKNDLKAASKMIHDICLNEAIEYNLQRGYSPHMDNISIK